MNLTDLNKAESHAYRQEFTAEERRKLASEGKALPDGSYPIPTSAHLHPAAVLARTHHGDWKAAATLIARRAKELGASNPLDDDADELQKRSVERTQELRRQRADGDDSPDSIAAELKAMEAARRDETDPDRQSRMDRAIRHARKRHSALSHPEQAEKIAKAERAEAGREALFGDAKDEIERRVRKGVPLHKAIRDVTKERAADLLKAS